MGCVPRVGRGPRVPILSRCRPPAGADSERKQKLLSLLGGGGEAKQNRRGYFKPDLISPLSPPSPAPATLPHHPPPPSSAALLGELLTLPALFSVRGGSCSQAGWWHRGQRGSVGAVLWAAVPRHPSRDTLALPRVPALPEKSLSPFPSCLGFCIPLGHQLWVSPLIQPCSILCELSLGSFPSQHPPCPPLGAVCTSPRTKLRWISGPGSGLPSPSGQATRAN